MFALMLLGGANEVSPDAPAPGQEEANSQTAGGQIVPEQRTHTSRLGRQSRAKSKLTQCDSDAGQPISSSKCALCTSGLNSDQGWAFLRMIGTAANVSFR
jgi:hypothetical protein